MDRFYDEPTIESCCCKDEKERELFEKRLAELKSVDVSNVRLSLHKDVFRDPAEFSTSSTAFCSGQTNQQEPVIAIGEQKNLTELKEIVKNATSPLVVHMYRKRNQKFLKKLMSLLESPDLEIQFLNVQVLTRRLVETEFESLMLPSLMVFADRRLIAHKCLFEFLRDKHLNLNKVRNFLRLHLRGFSSEEETGSEEECEICDRRYPHEHILPSKVSNALEASSSDDE